MFRVFQFYSGRFTGSGFVPPAGIVQMTSALQRIGGWPLVLLASLLSLPFSR